MRNGINGKKSRNQLEYFQLIYDCKQMLLGNIASGPAFDNGLDL